MNNAIVSLFQMPQKYFIIKKLSTVLCLLKTEHFDERSVIVEYKLRRNNIVLNDLFLTSSWQ